MIIKNMEEMVAQNYAQSKTATEIIGCESHREKCREALFNVLMATEIQVAMQSHLIREQMRAQGIVDGSGPSRGARTGPKAV